MAYERFVFWNILFHIIHFMLKAGSEDAENYFSDAFPEKQKEAGYGMPLSDKCCRKYSGTNINIFFSFADGIPDGYTAVPEADGLPGQQISYLLWE